MGHSGKRVVKKRKRLILLVNDDGFHAEGLQTLYKALCTKHDVWIVAPAHEVSAIGHAITLREIVRVEQIGERFFAVQGNPTDCVNLGIYHILPAFPDCILSGINHGWNVGEDVFYSGTVAGAMEGCIHGIPSFALSAPRVNPVRMRECLQAMAEWVRDNLEWLCTLDLPSNVFLNINWPNEPKPRGVEWTALARLHFQNYIEVRKDPYGEYYYWITRLEGRMKPEEGSDLRCVIRRRVSLTPLSLDMTDRETLRKFRSQNSRG